MLTEIDLLCDFCQEQESTLFVWVPNQEGGKACGGGCYKIACEACARPFNPEDTFPLEPEAFDDIGSAEGGP